MKSIRQVRDQLSEEPSCKLNVMCSTLGKDNYYHNVRSIELLNKMNKCHLTRQIEKFSQTADWEKDFFCFFVREFLSLLDLFFGTGRTWIGTRTWGCWRRLSAFRTLCPDLLYDSWAGFFKYFGGKTLEWIERFPPLCGHNATKLVGAPRNFERSSGNSFIASWLQVWDEAAANLKSRFQVQCSMLRSS